MGRADYMKLGTWNAICDRCGFKFKADQLKKEWTGLRVCKRCWDPKHPQESLKGRKEDVVPWTRPDSNANTSVTIVDGSTLTTDNYYDTVGDADKTLTAGTNNPVQEWSTDLTADRTATLSRINAQEQDRWSIYRTGGGNFDLIIRDGFDEFVSPIIIVKAVIFSANINAANINAANIKSLTIVEYRNGAWTLESYTALGL